jgi:hypothetical protein
MDDHPKRFGFLILNDHQVPKSFRKLTGKDQVP